MSEIIGDSPLTNAEKQARHRAKKAGLENELRSEIEELKADNRFLLRELRRLSERRTKDV